jgi:hypothetical protein
MLGSKAISEIGLTRCKTKLTLQKVLFPLTHLEEGREGARGMEAEWVDQWKLNRDKVEGG